MKRFRGLVSAVSVAVPMTALLALPACSSDDETSLGSATGGTISGSGRAVGSGGTDSGGSSCVTSEDLCAYAPGLTHDCRTRFALGVNYAWHYFAGDFGGIPSWNQPGVSENPAISTEMAEMAANGVTAIRWWMFPDFRGDGVAFEGDDPSGISPNAVADIQKALELAEANDLYLVFTLFSFDNFKADAMNGDILVRGISPMVKDVTRRKKVIDNIVRPIARAVAESPHKSRLLGWDIINEPEWAVAPAGLASNDFTPDPKLTTVTVAEMKAFISEAAAALGEEAPGTLRSVGWAAAKWAGQFTDIANLDFHQPHIYAWVHDYWPYTQTPAELGYGDKPTVMGEFYLAALPLSGAASGGDTPFSTIVTSFYDNGYAGAWAWQYNENKDQLGLLTTFAETKGCSTKF